KNRGLWLLDPNSKGRGLCGERAVSCDSLQFKLLLWVFPPILLFACLSTYVIYEVATNLSYEIYDEVLLNSADSVLARIRNENGNVRVDLPQAAQEILKHNDRDRFFFEVSKSDGTFLAGDPNIP